MKQIDIDRYNKWQDKYDLEYWGAQDILTITKKGTILMPTISFYDLLLNPKYGWREIFDKDPDYQKEFKKWIIKNKYGAIVHTELWLYNLNRISIAPTPDMLIGYIVKFMEERLK